jgi:acyl-CoA thioester hydrolase
VEHVFPVRVYYEDTDAGGIVYYANYLKFAERARTELLRDVGIEQARLLEDPGLGFAVQSCAVTYRRPARLDDALEVHSVLRQLSGATIHARQRIMRGAEEVAQLDVSVVCLKRDGRPGRIPGDVRHALQPYVQSRETQ